MLLTQKARFKYFWLSWMWAFGDEVHKPQRFEWRQAHEEQYTLHCGLAQASQTLLQQEGYPALQQEGLRITIWGRKRHLTVSAYPIFWDSLLATSAFWKCSGIMCELREPFAESGQTSLRRTAQSAFLSRTFNRKYNMIQEMDIKNWTDDFFIVDPCERTDGDSKTKIKCFHKNLEG